MPEAPNTPAAQGERIIREHRKWTRQVQGRHILGRGNLVLTNRRLLFLRQIGRSPEVEASIKRLAHAPIQEVLDHAFTLDKNNLQVHLSRIREAKAGVQARFPVPRASLQIIYLDDKKRVRRADFQFEMPIRKLFTRLQFFEDRAWAKEIKQAVQEYQEQSRR